MAQCHAERICAANEPVPQCHALRHDPAKPHEYEKLKSYECGPLLTGIQSPRITTYVVYHVGISEHKFRRAMEVVVLRRPMKINKRTPYEGTPFRGVQVFKHIALNKNHDMLIVLLWQV